jgi:hypothetical protein
VYKDEASNVKPIARVQSLSSAGFVFFFMLYKDMCVRMFEEIGETLDLVFLNVIGDKEDIIVDFVGLLGKLGFPECSVLDGDGFLDRLDVLSVLGGLSGDHEPVDLLGESPVVREDREVRSGMVCFTNTIEDGSVFSFVITSSKVSEVTSAFVTSG